MQTQQKQIEQPLTERMQDLLHRARQQGATDAFVTGSHDCGFSVDVRMGEVDTLAFSEDQSISVTVYVGQRKGMASSTDTSPQALDAMVSAALDIAKVSAEDPCFGLPDKAIMRNDFPDLDLYHPWAITPSEAIEKALACEQAALDMDTRITNSDGVNVSTYTFCSAFATSDGNSGIINSSRHSVSCALLAKEGDSMQRDYDYTTARCMDDLMPLGRLAKNAVERTTSRLGARRIKTQKAPILFSSRVSSGLFSTFIGAISGASLYRKQSFLLDSIGKSLFPASIRVYEQPHLLRALGSTPFDGEGVPTRNNVFVEDGTICQYVLGTYSARRLGLKTTANSGGVSNLRVDPTAGDFDDLLKQLDTGLLVTEMMGHGINLLTGDYSRGATGFWVEKGEIQYPVEEITIAGNLKNMFQGIVAVGSDWNPSIATRCGSVLIDEMTVAGE